MVHRIYYKNEGKVKIVMIQWKVNGLGKDTRTCSKQTKKISKVGRKTLRTAAFMAFVFGAMFVPYEGFAQEEAPVQETGTVVVTGTMTEQLIEEVPKTMQVFTKKDIERMGASTVRDVLNSATGLSLEGQKGGINFRGMGFDNTVLLINGRRVATAENTKDAHNFYLNTINPNSIERIEIVRGQAGALYGADAIGGVVNIITKKSEEMGGTVGIEMGNEYFKNYWQLETGKIGKFDAIFNASIKKLYPGVKENKYTQDADSVYTNKDNGGWQKSYDGYELAFNLDMGYAFNDDHEIRFIGEWANRDYEYEAKANGTTSYVSTTYQTGRRYGGALVYSGTIDDHMLNISANYSEMQIDKYRDPIDVQNMAGYQSSLVDSSEKYYTDIFTTFVLNASDSWSITDWNTLTFGGEYSYSTTNQTTAIFGDSLSYWSLFLQDEIVLFDDSLFILLQGRYDHYDAEFGGAFSPSVGVTWEFIEDHRVKANWGMGFRAPTLAMLYGTETTGSGTVYGNAALKPEKSKNFELRYEGSYGPVSGSVGYYYSYIEDYMSSEAVDINQYPALGNVQASKLRTNIGKVRNQGIELEAAWQVHDYVKLKASYVKTDAQDLDSGRRVTYTATDVVNAGIDFYYPEWGLSANLWGTYNENYKSEQSTKYGGVIYDFYTVNFSAAKTWGDEDQYKVTLALYNFLQSVNNAANITSLNPFEVRVGFEMKF